ncbi:hypothetical protein ATANTOWER_002239 [Ataeniobius toweri]|uniref:Prolactin receptor n=1 Tax=Ataeniobius toweri TaxID=208326 RepID=A0ABU7BG41_9TELE|nr:hypothetical protein [Ataeniobius toweri]
MTSGPLKKKSYLGQHQIKKKTSIQGNNDPSEGGRLLQKTSGQINRAQSISKDSLMGGGAPLPLGESTLALDEEMLQVLDAVDLSKGEVKMDVKRKQNSDAFPPPRPTTQTAHSEMEGNSAKMKEREWDSLPHTNGGDNPQQKGCKSRGDSNRPGWRADCKDLAQKLLFGEDSGEVDHSQRNQQNNHSNDVPASVSALLCKETHNGQKAGSPGKQKPTRSRSPPPDYKDNSSKKSNPRLDVSTDYILFSPTCLAAARRRTKLPHSLQNQSASVLTVPSGLELSTLSNTLPPPG